MAPSDISIVLIPAPTSFAIFEPSMMPSLIPIIAPISVSTPAPTQTTVNRNTLAPTAAVVTVIEATQV